MSLHDWLASRWLVEHRTSRQEITDLLAIADGRERHHERVLLSLAYTLELEADRVTQLDYFRRKRNVGWYERVGATSEHEVEAMRGLAQELRARVVEWLRDRHPELL